MLIKNEKVKKKVWRKLQQKYNFESRQLDKGSFVRAVSSYNNNLLTFFIYSISLQGVLSKGNGNSIIIL